MFEVVDILFVPVDFVFEPFLHEESLGLEDFLAGLDDDVLAHLEFVHVGLEFVAHLLLVLDEFIPVALAEIPLHLLAPLLPLLLDQ